VENAHSSRWRLEAEVSSPSDEANSALDLLTPVLASIPGVVAVSLGGSRAKGTATQDSDTDIGLYFRKEAAPRAEDVRRAVANLIDNPATAVVTEAGAWGPWIVGGAWLKIAGQKVDLLYRGVEAVGEVIEECRTGHVRMDYQPGHPHGFCSAIWMGEVALGRPLHDPAGVLARLKAMTTPYPEPLRAALIAKFQWEVLFSIENGETALGRSDETHIAGCAYRALSCVAQALFAINRRYLINEKGALDEAAGFPATVPGLTQRAAAVWRGIGNREFRDAFSELRRVERELAVAKEEFS
jgi:predicted nucleotidyltransferase